MENYLNFAGIEDAYFLIGEMTAFSNRFQAVADRFFADISWKQCFLLICIKMFQQPPTLKELAVTVGSSHQNVKQLLLKLERVGYVEFIRDENDKRKQRVIRTKKAEVFDETHDEPSTVFMQKFFENVSPDKIKITIETLVQLENNLKEMEKQQKK
ncbi:MAG: MarR family transcriptional regulator [Lachnospiraceae bacterium]|nr:MarR family transcriptional regulator [Lachnospiraceae bacterium]